MVRPTMTTTMLIPLPLRMVSSSDPESAVAGAAAEAVVVHSVVSRVAAAGLGVVAVAASGRSSLPSFLAYY